MKWISEANLRLARAQMPFFIADPKNGSMFEVCAKEPVLAAAVMGAFRRIVMVD